MNYNFSTRQSSGGHGAHACKKLRTAILAQTLFFLNYFTFGKGYGLKSFSGSNCRGVWFKLLRCVREEEGKVRHLAFPCF